MKRNNEWERVSLEHKRIISQHWGSPPVKIATLAKELGVSIKGATLPVGISGEIRPSKNEGAAFIIRVNKHDPAVRQRFTAAHELAHFLLHSRQIGDGISDDVLYRSSLSDAREAEANRLAAEILMPQALIDEWLANARTLKVDNPIEYLAHRFEVSEAAMKIRLGLM